MKKVLFVINMITIFSTLINAQVLTRHLSTDQKMEEIITFPINSDTHYYLQPEIDFEKVLEQDRLQKKLIPRFAVKVPQNYTVLDGTWNQVGSWMIWQIGFSATHASSLNFLISDLNLPEKSEMFIISNDGRMIHGPITPEVIFDNTYASDIIESSKVQIIVKCNKNTYQKFNMTINGICQGIPKPVNFRDFGDAVDCNIDINCSQGAGWENERDAVALVLRDGAEWCSGSLVNDQCQDLRSFFLTAFHCFDSDNNGSLSNQEKNLSTYAFRFKYEAGTPTCPGNSTGTQGTWIVYSGAAFRAANFASDFALAELNGSIANQPKIALAGWERSGDSPIGSVCIHHPAGDAKKISTDINVQGTSSWNGVDNHWVSIFEQGTVQFGSSGAPLFDLNHRIVGQLHGDQNNQGNFCNQRRGEFGKFDISWTGGGTDDTRLSNWLGGANPPNTSNTIKAPFIESTTPNHFLICTTNKQIVLSSPIPGKTISWSVSNPSLFATTGDASISGIGLIATLRAANNASSGSSIITFILSQAGCNDIKITQELWVGLPDFNLSNLDNICVGSHEIASIDVYGPYNLSLGTIQWSFSGALSGVGTTVIGKYKGVKKGWGNICLTATNGCGTTTKCYWVYVDDCKYLENAIQNPGNSSDQNIHSPKLILSPNPIKDILSIKLENVENDLNASLVIYNANGNLILTKGINESNVNIDMSSYLPGCYFVQYRSSNQITTNKIIKQ